MKKSEFKRSDIEFVKWYRAVVAANPGNEWQALVHEFWKECNIAVPSNTEMETKTVGRNNPEQKTKSKYQWAFDTDRQRLANRVTECRTNYGNAIKGDYKLNKKKEFVEQDEKDAWNKRIDDLITRITTRNTSKPAASKEDWLGLAAEVAAD